MEASQNWQGSQSGDVLLREPAALAPSTPILRFHPDPGPPRAANDAAPARSVEIFAGCGCLGFGTAAAGFRHELVVERDPHALETLRLNKDRGVGDMGHWPIDSRDAAHVDYGGLAGSIELVSGGPPCQPFSIGGLHAGALDPRNMWPEAIRAVRELRPAMFLFENVRGLLRPAFSLYLDYLTLQLRWPEFAPRGDEGWERHHARLLARKNRGRSPSYDVFVRGINAADYGAAQQRHRVMVLGAPHGAAQGDLFPEPTHSRDALLWDQWIDGRYWDRHGLARPGECPLAAATLEQLKRRGRPLTRPWRTVRDAIGDLPEPDLLHEPVFDHRLRPGARIYPRHTGSVLDLPAKTIKAGVHGTPGGENVLIASDGRPRYFTVREMARLQGLPDDFRVSGGWKHAVKQLGNAVPIEVGRLFGASMMEILRRRAEEVSGERTSPLKERAVASR